MNLENFIDFRRAAQSDYLKQPVEELSATERTAYAKAFISYVIEECVEINRELSEGDARYKFFKPSKPVDKAKLLEEYADLVIHVANLGALLTDDSSEIIDSIQDKIDYNNKRTDHVKD